MRVIVHYIDPSTSLVHRRIYDYVDEIRQEPGGKLILERYDGGALAELRKMDYLKLEIL